MHERAYQSLARGYAAHRVEVEAQVGDRANIDGREIMASLAQALVEHALRLRGDAGHQHAFSERASDRERHAHAFEFLLARHDRVARDVAFLQPVILLDRASGRWIDISGLQVEDERLRPPAVPQALDPTLCAGPVQADAQRRAAER